MTIRERILAAADLDMACRYAEVGAHNITKDLNRLCARGMNNATQVMARALVVRCIVDVGAQWLSDVNGQPLPECFKAIMDLIENPPPEIDGDVVKDEANAIEH